MTYPCGIIRDLLPLYADNVCHEESERAVAEHLSACQACRQQYEAMKRGEGFPEAEKGDLEDMNMVNGLKKIKSRMNRKVRNIILCSAAAALALVVGVQVLFHMPLKEIDPEDVKVTGSVYPIRELPHELSVDTDAVKLSVGEGDTSATYKIEIPAMPDAEITMTEETMDRTEAVTVLSWSSPYFVREMKTAQGPSGNEKTLYVEAFKTTLLNNKAPDHLQTMQTLEFREIDRVVFLGAGGEERVLWSKE